MKRILCAIIAVLLLLTSLPVSATEAKSADYVEVPATLLFSYMVKYSFKSTLELTEAESFADSIPYIHSTLEPGTYNNNQGVLEVKAADVGINMLEYPFVKLEYRTDSPYKTNDITIYSSKGENWTTPKHSHTADGEFHDIVFDIRELNDVETKIPTYEDGVNIRLRLKPLGAGTRTLEAYHYYDIKYIAFFKTEADALAHTYNYNMLGDDYAGAFKTPIEYLPLTNDAEDEILSGAESLKKKIINSESISPDSISGTVYYVSNNGNDNNSGTSPENALATISAVNALALNPGDGVFFERGSLFRGPTLSMKAGVTYSSYGKGDKPKIWRSIDGVGKDKWHQTPYKNVWQFETAFSRSEDIGNIIFNGGKAWGIKIIKEDDNTRQNQDLVYNGYESFVSSGNMPFIDERDLSNELEFWHSTNDGNVYLYYSHGNPGELFDSIELSRKGHCAGGSSDNVTVDNIAFGYTGSHGIGTSNAKNFKVQYCTFEFVGGSLQYTDGRGTRYGNAVENWASCDGFVIDHCYATQTYDCCYTTQWQGSGSTSDIIMQNVVFSNTVSEYSNSGPEVWLAANDNDTTHTYMIKDMDAYNNYVLYGGYGWSHQRPNKDGNFFYGGYAGATTVFDNVTYHDNIFFKATHLAVKARYSKKGYGYDFTNNVFVMAEGQQMVATGTNLNDCSGQVMRYKYNERDLKTLVYYGFFTDSTFYHYDIENAAIPMPENDYPYTEGFEYVTIPKDITPGDYEIITAEQLLEWASSSQFNNMPYSKEIIVDENGVNYFRLNSKEGTYRDGECAYTLPLSSLEQNIEVKKFPFIKIGYKTNIQSDNVSIFNYYTQYNSTAKRLWGPTIYRNSNEEPQSTIIKIKGSTSGGESLSSFDLNNINDGAVYEKLHIKPWGAQTITVPANEYYDISYIAFFENMNDAMFFEYPERITICGDVNDDKSVDIADEILLARYNSSIPGYLHLSNIRAGDLNADYLVSVIDSVILARHIANWSDYKALPYKTED